MQFPQVIVEASTVVDQSESAEALPPAPSGLEPEEPTPSPVSDVSSGYMSTSISMGTLNEAPISTSDQTTSATMDFESESFANQDGLEVGTPVSPPIKTADADKDEVEEPLVCHGDKDEQPEASEDQTKLIPQQASSTQEELTDIATVSSSSPSEAETDVVTSSFASQEEKHTTNLECSTPEDSPSSLVPTPVETQPLAKSSAFSAPEVPLSGTPAAEPPLVPDTSSEVAQEPRPPTSPQAQSPCLPKDTSSDSQRPPPAVESSSQASSLTHQSEAQIPPLPTTSTTNNQPSPKALATGNPFTIQKIKTSDIKSFRGIVEKSGEQGESSNLLSISEPLERLEIISDSEEGIEGQEGPECPLPDWLKEDIYVTVGTNKHGTVRYVGPTEFAEGTWVGVELDVPAGMQFSHGCPMFGCWELVKFGLIKTS